ncbi:MAG: hypothetical protein R3Y63_14660 [Eubacteriales bacterium]
MEKKFVPIIVGTLALSVCLGVASMISTPLLSERNAITSVDKIENEDSTAISVNKEEKINEDLATQIMEINTANLNYITHPIIVDDVFFSDLLINVESIIFESPDETDSTITILEAEDLLFSQFINIFNDCYISPIDYQEYLTGGGLYTDDNMFFPEMDFLGTNYQSDNQNSEQIDHENNSYAKVAFCLINEETIMLEIFSNYNLILSNTSYNDTKTWVNYQLPYCLTGDNKKILHEMNVFFNSSEFKSIQS